MDQTLTLRPARADDAPRIAAIHCASWRDTYSNVLSPEFLAGPIEQNRSELWAARLAVPEEARQVLVAESPSTGPAAFLSAYRDADAQWGSLIENLHVSPALRGQKIGERLIRAAATALAAQAKAAGVYLWMFEANQAGLRFYQRLGGEVVERSTSKLAEANGATILRVAWPALDALRV